jgi:hypothetical protein
MPKSRSIDIDTEEDFLLATELLEETWWLKYLASFNRVSDVTDE